MTKQIELTKGKYATVDDEDYERVINSGYSWCTSTHGTTLFYGYGSTDGEVVLMHRFILGVGKGTNIDHIDGNGLNNTRGNLRIATQSQNMFNKNIYCNNKTGFKGVYFHCIKKKYRAAIRKDRKEIHLGYFTDPIMAAQAYNKAALEYFGEFARLNPV